MKLALASLLVFVAVAPARADDTGMKLMQVMMRTPAISADGKHIAMYSLTATKDKKAKTALVVFAPEGTVEQRIEIVPPMTDATRAAADADKVAKVLDDGGYKRMSRVAVKNEKNEGTSFSGRFSSEDVVLDIKLAKRKLTIDGTRAGKKLATITKTLPKDTGCKSVDSYSLTNTMSGFDATSGAFAFQITASDKATVCFSHELVVTLK